MKTISRCIVPAALIAIATGCTSPSTVMQAWVGHHQGDLIQSWGPPTRTTSDGRGGEILVYEYDRNMGQIPGRAVRNYDGSVSYTSPQSNGYVASRMFWVNKEGIIYTWQWKGM